MTQTTPTRLHGYAAIEYAERTGATLSKYADPTEGARDGLSVAEAEEIARQDPGLIYLDPRPRLYVVSREYVGPSREPQPHSVVLVTTEPPRMNLSGEINLTGWLGTTRDWAMYAHGAYATLEEAQAAVRRVGESAGGTYELADADADAYRDESTLLVIGLGDHDPRSEWDAADWLRHTSMADVGLSESATAQEIEARAAALVLDARAEGVHIRGGADAIARVLREMVESEMSSASITWPPELTDQLLPELARTLGYEAVVLHTGQSGNASSPCRVWSDDSQEWRMTHWQECQWYEALEDVADGAQTVLVLSDVWLEDRRAWRTYVRAVYEVEYADGEYDAVLDEEWAPEGEDWKRSSGGGWYRVQELDRIPDELREVVRDAVAEWKSEQRRTRR